MFRGLYIENISASIDDINFTSDLISWCVKNKINEISIYGAATLVGSINGCILLNDFIGIMNKAGVQVALIASNINISINEYTKYYKLYPNKFSSITTEYEFWNTGKSYTVFKGQLTYLKSIHDETDGKLQRNIYVSQFEDASAEVTDQPTIIQRMINSSDRLFLVHYSINAMHLTLTLLTKLRRIAKAADDLNKNVDVVFLFNLKKTSSDPNSFDYFSTHKIDDAFNSLVNEFKNADIKRKERLNLIGYQLFNYSSAKLSNP